MNFFRGKLNSNKVFCIGFNKTGTTSIETALKGFGYKMGNQVKGELLLEKWYQRDFKSIIDFCKTAQAFQDIPFSLPFTYIFLDAHFKNAKFILTERDTPEQWYESLTTFHSKKWSDGNQIPTVSELKKANYRYQGFAFDFNNFVFGTSETDPYHKETLMNHYLSHINNVKEYFKSRPEKLLVINVSNYSDYGNLCEFLNQTRIEKDFPWENKTINR